MDEPQNRMDEPKRKRGRPPKNAPRPDPQEVEPLLDLGRVPAMVMPCCGRACTPKVVSKRVDGKRIVQCMCGRRCLYDAPKITAL